MEKKTSQTKVGAIIKLCFLKIEVYGVIVSRDHKYYRIFWFDKQEVIDIKKTALSQDKDIYVLSPKQVT